MHLLEAQVAAHGMCSEHIQKAPLKDSVATHKIKFRNNPPKQPLKYMHMSEKQSQSQQS